MTKTAILTLTLPMEQNFELVAANTGAALAEVKGLDPDERDEVRMAVIEACNNAFEHSDAHERQVDLTFEAMEDRLVITVGDRGQGFGSDPATLGPRQEPGGRKRGFGLRIMKAMMDQVDVVPRDGGGTDIVMIKLLRKAKEAR